MHGIYRSTQRVLLNLGAGAAVAWFAGPAWGALQQVSLASTMEPNGFISETAGTGSFARIGLGNGALGQVGARSGDVDGAYRIEDLNDFNPSQLGSGFDVFPREADFLVGSFTFDDAGITGLGTQTTAITALDLGELWTSDSQRTSSSSQSVPTVLSDISDHALGLWWWNSPGSIVFGPLDGNDTVTFVDGVLDSIDLDIDADFTIGPGIAGEATTWRGTVTVSGNQFSFDILDTQDFGFPGDSTLEIDLTGTVAAVGVLEVPEPASAFGVLGLLALSARPKRRDA